jgi:hypothetical protein
MDDAEYTVRVADNFHYMDEEESYTLGKFSSLDEAVTRYRQIVDDFLSLNHREGMTAKELFDQYKMFGEDPYVVEGAEFSAWKYAEKRCNEIANISGN